MPIYSQQKQHILSLATEIDGYKKSITKEQENNETLTLLLQKNEIDINGLRKQIATSQDRQEKIKQEYSTYSRMLHETEQALNRATTVSFAVMHTVNSAVCNIKVKSIGTEEISLTLRKFDLHGIKKKLKIKKRGHECTFDLGDFAT